MNGFYRYVPHDLIPSYITLGWMFVVDLNEYRCLMMWPCACKIREPIEAIE